MALFINDSEILKLTLGGTNIETLTLDGQVVARKPTITTQPTGTSIDDTQTATLTVVADGLGSNLTYQWYKNDVAIDGATSTSYTFDPSGTGTFSFYCSVNGFGGKAKTNTVSVVVEASIVYTASLTIASASFSYDNPGVDGNGTINGVFVHSSDDKPYGTGEGNLTIGGKVWNVITPTTRESFRIAYIARQDVNQMWFAGTGNSVSGTLYIKPGDGSGISIERSYHITFSNKDGLYSASLPNDPQLFSIFDGGMPCRLRWEDD